MCNLMHSEMRWEQDMAGLSFGEVEEILVRLNGVHPDRRPAFLARLKQWQKQPLNFPDGTNVGRGNRAVYGAQQLFQLALLSFFLEVGLPPERGISLIRSAWREFRAAIYDTLVCQAGEADHLHYMSMKMSSLRDLQGPSGPRQPSIDITTVTDADMLVAYAGESVVFRTLPKETAGIYQFIRWCLSGNIILDMDRFTTLVLAAMQQCHIPPDVFSEELAGWGSSGNVSCRFHRHNALAGTNASGWEQDIGPATKHGPPLARSILQLSNKDEARASNPDSTDINVCFRRWVDSDVVVAAAREMAAKSRDDA